MKIEEKNIITELLPKGLIFLALGGYLSENAEKTQIDTNEVVNRLTEFLKRNNFAIIVKENKLEFVPIVKRRKFLGLFHI